MGRKAFKKGRILIAAILLLAIGVSLAFACGAEIRWLGTRQSQNDADESIQDELSGTLFTNNTRVRQDITGSHASDTLIEGDHLVCENPRLQMYFNEETSILKIRDLDNGYIWASGKVNESTAEMTASWEKFAHCLVSAEFIDKGTMTTSTAMPNFKKQTTAYRENGIDVTVPFSKTDCTVTVCIRLEEDGLSVSVPDDTILMNEERKVLSKLYVLPFFGASMAGEGEGYLIIPDGCGALIRFGASIVGTGSYAGRIYGQDLSVSAVGSGALVSGATLPSKTVSLPVFGIVHGYKQNGVMYEITQGQEYCEIVASPAGNKIDWYWAAPHFVYNERYFQQDNAGSGFILAQEQPNKVNAAFRMRFFSGDNADYVGMGQKYRELLIQREVLAQTVQTDETIPLMLDCLMAESEDTGIFTQALKLTTLADLENWRYDLGSVGIERVVYSLRGAGRGGYSKSDATNFGLWRKIGSESEAQRLMDGGMNLIYNKDMLMLFSGQMNQTYYSYAIDRGFVEQDYQGYLDDTVYFASVRGIWKIVGQADENPFDRISVNSLSNLLMGNYRAGDIYTRTDAMEQIKDALAQLRENQQYVMLQTPNEYALPYADAIYDLPLENSGYLFETDSVPFLQIVMGGSVDQFTQANYVVRAENRSDILRLIDYNVYPQFTVTAADETELAKTNSNMLYCSQFDTLFDDIQQIYHMVDAALSPVQGASMIRREVIQNDFVITTYSNGCSILINYSGSEITVQGVAVPAYSAITVSTELLEMNRGD